MLKAGHIVLSWAATSGTATTISAMHCKVQRKKLPLGFKDGVLTPYWSWRDVRTELRNSSASFSTKECNNYQQKYTLTKRPFQGFYVFVHILY